VISTLAVPRPATAGRDSQPQRRDRNRTLDMELELEA